MSGSTNDNTSTDLVVQSAIALGRFLQSHTRETLRCANPECARPFGQTRKCYIACAPEALDETSDAALRFQTPGSLSNGDERGRVCLLCENCLRYTDEEMEELAEICTSIEDSRWSKNCDIESADMRCRNCERLGRLVRNKAFTRPGYAQEFHDHLEGMQVFDEGMAPLIDKTREEDRKEVEKKKSQHKAKTELRKEEGNKRTAALWEKKKERDASEAAKIQLADRSAEEAYQRAVRLSEEKAAREMQEEENQRREAARAKQAQLEAKRRLPSSSNAKSTHREKLRDSINQQRGNRGKGKRPKGIDATEGASNTTRSDPGEPSTSTTQKHEAAADDDDDELEEWGRIELFTVGQTPDPVPVESGAVRAPIAKEAVASDDTQSGVDEHQWYKQIQAALDRVVEIVGTIPLQTSLPPSVDQEETRDVGTRAAAIVDCLCTHIGRVAEDLADADRAATFFAVELFKKKNKHVEITREALTVFAEKYEINPRFLQAFDGIEATGRKRKRRNGAPAVS